MVIKSLLSKVKDTWFPGSDTVFNAVFKPLQVSHPRLFKEVMSFCTNGEPVSALLQARQTAIANPRDTFGLLTNTQHYWYAGNPDCMHARAKAYTLLADGLLTPEAVMRMGKVFAELLNTDIVKHTHDDFPDWLHVVLSDWLYCTRDTCQGSDRKTSGIAAPSLELLGGLCRADDLPEHTWLLYYLDRKGVSLSYWSFESALKQVRGLDGLAHFFSTHREAILADHVPKLTAAGRAQLIVEIGELQIAEAYADFIIDQSVDSSKTVRNRAARLMTYFPEQAVHHRLGDHLSRGNATERKQAAELIGRMMGEAGRGLLEAALESETSKSVKSAIQVALSASRIEEESAAEEELDIPSYSKPDLTAQVSEAVTAQIQANIRRLQDKYRDMETPHTWLQRAKKQIMSLSRSDAIKVVNIMNGRAALKGGWHAVASFMNEEALFDDPSIELIHVLRLHGRPDEKTRGSYRVFPQGPLGIWMKRQKEKLTDLRTLADVLACLKWPDDFLEREIVYANWWPSILVKGLPPEGIWPYFAERMEPLVKALMGQGAGRDHRDEISMDRVMEVLACFPRLPVKTRAPLLQIALGEGKTYRRRAQAMLESVPDIQSNIKAALKSNTQNVRANAAQWLGRLGDTQAVDPLKAALAKESREAVRAVIISALEQLGQDISDLLDPDLLYKEAVKGLKKQMPKGLAWFPFDSLPSLAWSDGSPVPRELPRWWVVLACKLKDSDGGLLMLKYLQRLDNASRQALGLHVLRAFIVQDTRGPTPEEAEQKAQQGAAALLQQWQRWAQSSWGESFRNKTLEDAHADIYRQVIGTYLGSAIKEKGILSLCACTPGSDAVPLLQRYMKDHYTRRHQIEAMLRAVARGDDPHVIQLLLSVARRYRTRSVQEAAGQLVQAVADRNGWTPEQLADRTMPTAGFESNGTQILDYGARQFTLMLDDQLKPVLINEKDKPVKSLPAPRQADDPDLAKEAKARFSAAKKELKQVVQLTTGRLYEAMCAGRRWPAAEWRRYLLDHPIGMRLIQRLIWCHEDGARRFCFRPSEDGTLISAEDDECTLSDDGAVHLLHRSTLSDDEARAWRSHLKDYKVKPLFEQIERPVPPREIDLAAKKLDTYLGYMSDTFTLRGTLTKLGYQRGTPEDGGFFYYYFKDFISLDLRAVIFFSGNCVPEENVPAALEQMGFCTLNDNGWFNEAALKPLAAVPPILLSEIMADYQAVAQKTGGFDPDWKKKMPW